MTPKHPHPSGRPIRRERKVGRQFWNYTANPDTPYATARLRRTASSPLADAVAYKTVERQDGADPWASRIGFVIFP